MAWVGIFLRESREAVAACMVFHDRLNCFCKQDCELAFEAL